MGYFLVVHRRYGIAFALQMQLTISLHCWRFEIFRAEQCMAQMVFFGQFV